MAQKRKKTTTPPEPSADERMAWLLAFLDRDVTALRVGELFDVGVDVTRYLLDPRATIVSGEDDAEAVILFKEVIAESLGERPAWIDPNDRTGTERITEDDVPALKRPFLQKLQDTLRLGMRSLADGTAWMPFEGDVLPPKLLLQRRRDGTLERSYYAGATLPLFLASAIDLITQFWPQIRQCQYAPCGKFFLPRHGRQTFHAERCSALARQQRFRDTHGPRDHKRELIRRVELENKRKRARKGKRS